MATDKTKWTFQAEIEAAHPEKEGNEIDHDLEDVANQMVHERFKKSDFIDMTRWFLIERKKQAEEIKRLNAEKASIPKEWFAQSAKIEGDSFVQAGVVLPDGCDPWNLERAQKEGAVSESGRRWQYISPSASNGHSIFQVVADPQRTAVCNDTGIEVIGGGRLYCIKESK